MGRRGPKKKVNMVRKWWRLHKITAGQIDRLVKESKAQLPLLAHTIDPPLIIAALIARETKKVDDDLYNANDLLKCFHIEDEEVEDIQTDLEPGSVAR